MPNYDLSTPKSISIAAKAAAEHASNEPSQSSYNAAWLHGYAWALSDVAEQLKTHQRLVDNLLEYLGDHLDKGELYSILHDDLEMNQDEISCLGFEFDKHEEQAVIKQEDFLFLSDAFKDKALSHWSFTGLYEEHEKALRGLLDSGKDFDTGEGYSEDETIFLRICAQGNNIKIILRQEFDYDDAQPFVRDLAKGDTYEEILTDELVCELAEHFSSKPFFNEGISEHCSLSRQASFEDVMESIGILENMTDNRMKAIWTELRSSMHEELLSAIPDEISDLVFVDKNRLTDSSMAYLTFDNSNGKPVVVVDLVYNGSDELAESDVECIYEMPLSDKNVKQAQEILKYISDNYHIPVKDNTSSPHLAEEVKSSLSDKILNASARAAESQKQNPQKRQLESGNFEL